MEQHIQLQETRVRESLARHMQALAVSMPGLSTKGHKEVSPIFYYAL